MDEIKKTESENLLEIENLKSYFYTDDGVVKAVDGVHFAIDKRKVLGVVGESGCGKTVTALSILQLIPRPGRIVDGSIMYYSDDSPSIDITSLKPDSQQMVEIRGNNIAMVFQEPMTSLTPVYTIGHQIIEAIRLHQKVGKEEARQRAIEMLIKVGIPDPKQRIDEYPFRLSGGMRQRALIAMALSCNPSLLIADEPTTALDVTVQAQILRLMKRLQENMDMSIMFITHDLGVIADIAEDVVVMYLGKIVERGTAHDVFHESSHPYTQGLLNSVPRIDQRRRLVAIKGIVPTPFDLLPGCDFAKRCPHVMDKCVEHDPPEFEVSAGHFAKCWLCEKGS